MPYTQITHHITFTVMLYMHISAAKLFQTAHNYTISCRNQYIFN